MYINNDNLDIENDTIAELFSAKDESEVPVEQLLRTIDYEPNPDPDFMPKRTVELSPELALPKIRAHLDLGSPVQLTVTGNSMQPFLRDRRDSVILAPLKRRPKVGDIVFYLRTENTPVLHRVIEVPASDTVICCGDAQIMPEKVSRSSIIAIVTDIKHGEDYFSCGSAAWKLKSLLWMRLKPVRPRLLRVITAIRRFFKK